jgi:hypothetical protein
MAVNQRLDDLTDQRLDDEEQRGRHQGHAPSGINSHGECDRKDGRDESADIGHEAKHHCQNPEQHRVRHADQGQGDADDEPEHDIECSLRQKVSAQALGAIVDGIGSALQVAGSGEPDQTVPQILALR